MKLIDILKTASGNMLQSKLRTFLTIVAIFIGALSLTLTNGIGSGISAYIDQQVSNIGAEDVMFVQAKSESQSPTSDSAPKKYDPNKTGGNSGIPGYNPSVLTNKDLDVIRAIPGIKDAIPFRNVSTDYIIGMNGDKYVLSVAEYTDGTNIAMKAGALPKNSSTTPEISLTGRYIDSLGFSSIDDAIGKTVTLGVTNAFGIISEVKATLTGVEEKSLITGGSSNINTALVDKLYASQNEGLPAASANKYFGATAHFDSSLSATQIAELKTALTDKGYTGQTVEDQIGILKQVISGIVIVFDIFGAIALLAASFGVINTLLMAVQERTKEIGLMKAVGLGRRKIFLLFSTEAILLGFWGSFLGVLAAMGIGSIANKIATNGFLKDFEGLKLLTFPVQSVVVIMLIIMLITFLAGTLPARRASRLNPIDALRYE